jgi:hypothetical protein
MSSWLAASFFSAELSQPQGKKNHAALLFSEAFCIASFLSRFNCAGFYGQMGLHPRHL